MEPINAEGAMGKGIMDEPDSIVGVNQGGQNMKQLKNEAGFTMIELVWSSSSSASPRRLRCRSMPVSDRSAIAAVNGFAGGMRGAVAVVQAKYMVVGDITATGTL
jgi:hypothetical protein